MFEKSKKKKKKKEKRGIEQLQLKYWYQANTVLSYFFKCRKLILNYGLKTVYWKSFVKNLFWAHTYVKALAFSMCKLSSVPIENNKHFIILLQLNK